MFGHPGEAYGLVSDAYIDFDRNLGIVFMTNGSVAGYQVNNESAFYTVEKEIFEAIDPIANNLDCALTISELNNPNYTVYPNPFSTEVALEVEKETAPFGCLVVGCTGKILKKGNIIANLKNLNLMELPDGLYFLKISNSNISQFLKIYKNE